MGVSDEIWSHDPSPNGTRTWRRRFVGQREETGRTVRAAARRQLTKKKKRKSAGSRREPLTRSSLRKNLSPVHKKATSTIKAQDIRRNTTGTLESSWVSGSSRSPTKGLRGAWKCGCVRPLQRLPTVQVRDYLPEHETLVEVPVT